MTSKQEEDTKSIAVFTSHMIEERSRAMTRKEAINILKAYPLVIKDQQAIQEAIEMAIASLETDEAYQLEYEQPTTKNDLGVDAISRADVLRLMQDNWHTHNGDWAMQESMDDIRALPAVTPQEPRKGHWTEHPTEEDYSVCSRCGIGCRRMEHGKNADGTKYIDIYSYRFCPYCGAKMVEP